MVFSGGLRAGGALGLVRPGLGLWLDSNSTVQRWRLAAQLRLKLTKSSRLLHHISLLGCLARQLFTCKDAVDELGCGGEFLLQAHELCIPCRRRSLPPHIITDLNARLSRPPF